MYNILLIQLNFLFSKINSKHIMFVMFKCKLFFMKVVNYRLIDGY